MQQNDRSRKRPQNVMDNRIYNAIAILAVALGLIAVGVMYLAAATL